MSRPGVCGPEATGLKRIAIFDSWLLPATAPRPMANGTEVEQGGHELVPERFRLGGGVVPGAGNVARWLAMGKMVDETRDTTLPKRSRDAQSRRRREKQPQIRVETSERAKTTDETIQGTFKHPFLYLLPPPISSP